MCIRDRNSIDTPSIVAPTPSYFNIADTDDEAPGPLDELLGVLGSGAQHHYVRINEEPTDIQYTYMAVIDNRMVHADSQITMERHDICNNPVSSESRSSTEQDSNLPETQRPPQSFRPGGEQDPLHNSHGDPWHGRTASVLPSSQTSPITGLEAVSYTHLTLPTKRIV